jgi:hypothetical protein
MNSTRQNAYTRRLISMLLIIDAKDEGSASVCFDCTRRIVVPLFRGRVASIEQRRAGEDSVLESFGGTPRAVLDYGMLQLSQQHIRKPSAKGRLFL